MSGLRSRRKGLAFERSVVNLFRLAGLAAERIPLSGSAGGSFCSDVQARIGGRLLKFECKKRGDGFRKLYSWIDGNDGLILSADREAPLVVLRFEQFMQLVDSADKQREAA